MRYPHSLFTAMAGNLSFVDFEGAEDGRFACSGILSQWRHCLLELGLKKKTEGKIQNRNKVANSSIKKLH